ncbi:MlaC/ttg2D family ABC transporter substrate-binding protein [Aliiroseovarius sp. PTFE2010]|uniref:MlaC/ttg2D family ABC transporter substrate-binding protein n=1 Tax=Aliiroseovarius sp. PTFE2010 TaxID=3417190 RepID=UPI003CEA0718
MKRRTVIAGLAAGMFAPSTALAFSTAQAEKLIGSAVADITRIINSGKSEAAMLRDFEGIFSRYADVPTISRSVLGPPARAASSGQLSAFARAFQTYISRKYGRRFREFIGATVKVTGSRQVKSFYEVTTVTDLRGEAPFEVTFVVADRSGRFIDIRIEGVSLLKAERGEVGAMLDARRGNLDQLIADLPKV